MKLCTYVNNEGEEHIGAVKGEKIFELTGCQDMLELIRNYDAGEILNSLKQAKKEYTFEEVIFKAPVPRPKKMIFVGMNYHDHVKEVNCPLPEIPVIFSKYSNALTGHNEKVIIPRETKKCDYEAEFAFVIGKTARDVMLEDALNYVFGYTICNDVSARDLQNQVSQWMMGKTADTFAPMGPVVVTADEISDPHKLNINCKVNGVQRQKSNTKELIFNIPFLISYISRTVTLEPGDIISTGTPGGVAIGMKEPEWLKDGDCCEIEIEGIGKLYNTFIEEK